MEKIKRKISFWILSALMILTSALTYHIQESQALAATVNDTVTVENVVYTVKKDNSFFVLELSDGKKASGDLLIPEKIEVNGESLPVTKIAASAFQDNLELTSIDFSKTQIKEIGASSFSGCTQLEEVKPTRDFGKYLVVKTFAFRNCTSLTKLDFMSVQLLDANPFNGSGITEITIMKAINLSANVFSGMKEGFMLHLYDEISTSTSYTSMLGNTKNVTLNISNKADYDKFNATFGSKANVVYQPINVVVNGTGYENFSQAFTAIAQDTTQQDYFVTVAKDNLTWDAQAELPAKSMTINFRNRSVSLPSILNLQAPLTIQAIKNANNTELCTVTANNYPFVLEDGPSFGFKTISGNDLTFIGTLPSSTPMGSERILLIGTGDQSVLTFEDIGRSDYLYKLPAFKDFGTLKLVNAHFTPIDCSETKIEKINSTLDVTHQMNTDIWNFDENMHWHECFCHETIEDQEDHKWDEGKFVKKIDEETQQEVVEFVKTCEVCGHTQTHDHDHMTDEWKYDDTKHWQECEECQEILNQNEHIYVKKVIEKETVNKEGLIQYTCSICGHVYDEKTAKLPFIDDTKPETPKTGDSSIIYLSILMLVVSLGGITFLTRRKKNH